MCKNLKLFLSANVGAPIAAYLLLGFRQKVFSDLLTGGSAQSIQYMNGVKSAAYAKSVYPTSTHIGA